MANDQNRFTTHEITIIKKALALQFGSIRRAINTKREPEFEAIYQRQLTEIGELQRKLS